MSARLTKAQPETARLLAAVSRASLKSPYSAEVPNVWWRLRLRERMPRPRRPRLSAFARLARRLRPGVATSVLALLAAIGLGGCSAGATAHADPVVAFPTRLAPAIVGGLQAKEEPVAEKAYVDNAKKPDVLVSEGKVISFNRNGLVQAALQVAQLKPGYATTSPDVVKAITASVGDHVEQLRPEGTHPLWAQTDGSQRLFLWFPTAKAMALLVVRAEISEGAAEALARGLIDYGDGGTINERALAAALASIPGAEQPMVGRSGQPPVGKPPVVAPSPSPAASASTSAPAASSPEPTR